MWRRSLETRPASEALSQREFDQITELAYRTCGIDLKNGKQELVQARLGKKIRQGKFGSFKQYYEHVVADRTGEEPFTIACSLLEELGTPAASRIHILASDISSRALAAAERGAYEADRFKEFPKDWASKYLLRGSGQWEGWYRVKPPVRRL